MADTTPSERWITRNWLGVIMLLGSILWQGWAGSAWVFGRSAAEQNLTQQVLRLQSELDQLKLDSVRKDVFNVTMQSIDYRLSLITSKLAQQP